EVLMEDCGAILALAAEAAGSKRFSFRDRAIDPFAAPERLTVAEAFARHAGIDLAAMLPPQPAAGLAAAATAAGIRTRARAAWGGLGGGGDRRRHSPGRRRHLGRRFQPRAGRKDRTAPRARTRDDPLRISGSTVAARPAEGRRSPARRALRAPCLRGRACERLRRARRCGRATRTARPPHCGN